MNGFSVEASRYSGVLAGLATRGFVVASSDYYHNWTSPPPPPFPRLGCPESYVLVTAELLGTLLDFARGSATQDGRFSFLHSADLGRLVLLAHSAGGSVAMCMLSGSCGRDADLSPSMRLGCEGLAALHRRHGSALINGVFNKRTAEKAAATQGACHGYLQFNHMNHFGINDFYPNTHQVTPCASPNPSDDQSFETDAATQRAGLDIIAHTTAAWVRAFNKGDAAALDYLSGLADNPRVSAVKTASGCGFAVNSSSA
ncbi:hypothetical protein WJX81_006448 [Elliptochloris bilobata]|uniref:Chlorophyllase n=1 Tax=Elliptochloris bilobata TaxID=381761 RepID=A0AAW1RU86_9CHLO